MSRDYDELMDKYPLLYRQRNDSCMHTAMCWGICCGIGWYDLIDEMSETLEEEIKKLSPEMQEACCASQVKEKWGGLRVYLTNGTDRMYDIIEEAEFKSASICELCGSYGELRRGGWITCMCDRCYLKSKVTFGKSRLDLLVNEGIAITQEEWDEIAEEIKEEKEHGVD